MVVQFGAGAASTDCGVSCGGGDGGFVGGILSLRRSYGLRERE